MKPFVTYILIFSEGDFILNMSLFGIYVLSNLMEMSIEHDGRPLTRLIVGLEKYLIELTAGSVVHSYFLLTCSLSGLSFSNVRIFFMHR